MVGQDEAKSQCYGRKELIPNGMGAFSQILTPWDNAVESRWYGMMQLNPDSTGGWRGFLMLWEMGADS